MMKMVSTMGNARQVNAPRKSSCHTIGEMLGGMLMMLCGGAAVCATKADYAVTTIPSRIAPGHFADHQNRNQDKAEHGHQGGM